MLKVECDDLYSLCKEKEGAGLELLTLEEFFSPPPKVGSKIRLFFSKPPEGDDTAQINQIILEKK
jgi:hypothetical protein